MQDVWAAADGTVAAAAAPRVTPRRDRAWLVAAAVVVMAIGLTAWGISAWRARSSPTGAMAPSQVALDLRAYAAWRDPAAAAPRAPLSLKRGPLTLVITLPVGSAPGFYDVQVLDADLRTSRATGRGEAREHEYLTVLRVSLDLTGVAPGPYQLALRREAFDWHLFPAVVE